MRQLRDSRTVESVAETERAKRMSVAFVISPCVACHKTIHFHPHLVPSLRINGEREPLCANCFHEWNRIHRIAKGLDPIPLNPLAYEPCDESEL